MRIRFDRYLAAIGLAALCFLVALVFSSQRVQNTYGNMGVSLADEYAGVSDLAGRAPAMPAPPPGGAAKLRSAGEAILGTAAEAAPAAVPVARKVIMTANVTLEVKEFPRVHAAVAKVAREHGGYVANAELGLPSEGPQRGSVTLRVPQERYEAALAAVKALGKVVVESENAADVTEQYVDLEARVRNLKVEEARILDVLKRATAIKDIVLVEQRLSQVRERIEQIEGQFRLLQYQVAMATITVQLAEPTTALHLPEAKWSWFNEVRGAWHLVVSLAQALATVLTYIATLGVFWVPIVGVALVVVRRRARSGAPTESDRTNDTDD